MIRCYTTLFTAPADRDSSPQDKATEGKLQPEQRAESKLELVPTANVAEGALGRTSAPAPNAREGN